MNDYIKVGCGAAMGAVARFVLLSLGPAVWITVGINALGCFLMGRLRPGPFLGTGFLGGFTTFSAFMLAHHPAAMAVTVPACLAAWWAGDTACRRAGAA